MNVLDNREFPVTDSCRATWYPPGMQPIAYVITSHGFGHATRACAVMEAIRKRRPQVRFEIFTRVPEWLFEASAPGAFRYHPTDTDVGLVQATPLRADLPRTREALERFLPFDPTQITELVQVVRKARCRAVLCDIAPLGVAVAREAHLPSVLIENFRWDWIYEGYPEIREHAAYLREVFDAADLLVQTEPVCWRRRADLTSHPVSRPPRRNRTEVRRTLGIGSDVPLVMITMGGIPGQFRFRDRLRRMTAVHFLIPGGAPEVESGGNITSLTAHADHYHPDLVAASDAVIGKVGYSTLAEVYHAGVPFGYIGRPAFRESAVLADFIAERMPGFAIAEEAYHRGEWIDALPELLSFPRPDTPRPNGADEIAEFLDLGGLVL